MAEFQVPKNDPSLSLEEVWPPFGLRIESPRLVLRQVRETDFAGFLAAASSGIRNTEKCPFLTPWDDNPPEAMARNSLPYIWSQRAKIGPDHWYLMLGVFLKNDDRSEGLLIGVQDVNARNYRVMRTVNSGSWMRRDHQGQGLGKEMRAAMLLWAFDHFNAEYAQSGANSWNKPSQGVSASLGYQTVGRARRVGAYGDEAEEGLYFLLSADEFNRPDWDIEVTGNELLRDFMLLTNRHLHSS
ncbi:GNAT family N-acetyltransferase [Nesterenkonia ebinurensis]|uniref:GNAT family N-acetyltransferase n=1 Tax=Nesterenkonia ebinurensis TaxID=2608252 RepID=UPI00123DC904|nr:GNAT family protein [Nesterenkonia ebinurensis]